MDNTYYTGPTYGIRDRQCDPVVGYCRKCQGELYRMTESGLCEQCEDDRIVDLEGWPFET